MADKDKPQPYKEKSYTKEDLTASGRGELLQQQTDPVYQPTIC